MRNIITKMNRLIARIYLKFVRPDEMESILLRGLFSKGYDIDVGLYSYGCFDRDRFGPNMKIGKFCSFSRTCRRVNANHTMSYLSLHPFFYSPKFGVVEAEQISRSRCEIEDDVWVGHNVVILPSVTHIGRGAVLAAGAIVTKNVAPYSVVAGIPAYEIAKRFDAKTIVKIETSEWWNLSKEELHQLANEHWEWFESPSRLPGGLIANQTNRILA